MQSRKIGCLRSGLGASINRLYRHRVIVGEQILSHQPGPAAPTHRSRRARVLTRAHHEFLAAGVVPAQCTRGNRYPRTLGRRPIEFLDKTAL